MHQKSKLWLFASKKIDTVEEVNGGEISFYFLPAWADPEMGDEVCYVGRGLKKVHPKIMTQRSTKIKMNISILRCPRLLKDACSKLNEIDIPQSLLHRCLLFPGNTTYLEPCRVSLITMTFSIDLITNRFIELVNIPRDSRKDMQNI